MNSVVVTPMIVTTAFIGSRVSFGRKERSGRGTESAADDGTGLAADLGTNVGAERAACTASHRGARAVAVRTARSHDGEQRERHCEHHTLHPRGDRALESASTE